MTLHVFVSTEDCYSNINNITLGESVYPCKYPTDSPVAELNQSNILVISGSKLRFDLSSDKTFEEITDSFYDLSTPKDHKMIAVRLLGRRLNYTNNLLTQILDKAPTGTKFYLVQHGDNSHCIQYLKDEFVRLNSREDRYKQDAIRARFGTSINQDNYIELLESSFSSAWSSFNVAFSLQNAPSEFVNLSKKSIFGLDDDTDSGMSCRIFTKT